MKGLLIFSIFILSLKVSAQNDLAQQSSTYESYLTNSSKFTTNATAIADTTFFAVAEYMKVEPGMEADYLKTEALWKKFHQSRKDAKQIMNWRLFRRVFPSGTKTDFDYITVTSYQNGEKMQASETTMNWDAITKGMTTDETTMAKNTGKTRQLVNNQLFNSLVGFNGTQTSKYYVLYNLKTSQENAADYEKYLTKLLPLNQEVAKSGKLAAWSAWSNTINTNVNAPNYLGVYEFANMNDAINQMTDKLTYREAYRKVYSTENYDTVVKRRNELRQIVTTELWELVDGTK